jgi:hypothetical protein
MGGVYEKATGQELTSNNAGRFTNFDARISTTQLDALGIR